MEHVDDLTLAALTLDDTADLPQQAVADARAHLDECADCRSEAASLAELLVLAGDARETLAPPPPQVWQAIQAELDSAAPTTPDAAMQSPPVAQDQPVAAVTPLRPRRSVPTWMASVAAASALVVGVGAGALLGGGDDAPPTAAPEPQPSPAVVATASLTSLDEAADDRGRAEVRRHDDRVVLHVSPTDLDGPDGIREVWLINVDGSRMVSLGLLTPSHSGDFEFPEQLLEEGYRIVDISYEPDDGDPVHSGQSLARGTIDS